jgi:hypothetical protein
MGARETAKFIFLKKQFFVFFRDFGILPAISWMEDGESVDCTSGFQILGRFLPAGVTIARSIDVPRIRIRARAGGS